MQTIKFKSAIVKQYINFPHMKMLILMAVICAKYKYVILSLDDNWIPPYKELKYLYFC